MPQTRAAQRRSLARKCTPHVVVGMSDTFGCQAAQGVAPRSPGALVPRSPCQRAAEANDGGDANSMRRAAEPRNPENTEPGRSWRELQVLPCRPREVDRAEVRNLERQGGRCGRKREIRAVRAARCHRRSGASWERRPPTRNAVRASSVQRGRAMSLLPSARSRQPRSSASNESRDLRASRHRGRRASRDPAAERP